ncbi:MAG: hypothetical protein ABSF71_27180 [Terriglobia bacterium]|jgi:hypothetical protein
MDKPSDLVRIRSVLQLARAEIYQPDPDLALENLWTIKNEAEESKGTPEWAEFFLLFAEAHSAKCDALAETYLTGAEEQPHSLHDSFPDLVFRLSERFGDHYACVGKFHKPPRRSRISWRRQAVRRHIHQVIQSPRWLAECCPDGAVMDLRRNRSGFLTNRRPTST